MPIGPQIAIAATGLIGTPFRLHGRDAATGLDCIGLVLAAAKAAGVTLEAPARYSLRSADIRQHLRWFAQRGVMTVAPDAPDCPGDIVAVRPSPTQLHLMIFTGGGLVHAHAGLRRAVCMPPPGPWPVWRRTRIAD